MLILFRFSDDKHILWSIFRKYTEQLYTWALSPVPTISQVATASLDKLWKQTPDSSVYLRAQKTARFAPSKWANLDLETPTATRAATESFSRLDHVIVYSDVPENFVRSVIGSMDNDTFDAFVKFLYRSDACTSSSTLLQLFGLARAIPMLDEFLQNNFSAVRRGLSPMDDFKFELRFSKIPKDLSRFVNNQLYSDVIFVFDVKDSDSETDSPSTDTTSEPTKTVEVHAHKVILSKCGYFEGMFGAGLRESKQLRISIADIDPDVFVEVCILIRSQDSYR